METRDVQVLIDALGNESAVIVPTDTVYGFAARIGDAQAINQIYDLKQRPRDKALILFGDSIAMVQPYVEAIPKPVEYLMQQFWPGALTIILKKSTLVPDYVNAGLETIALRVPQSSLVKELVTAVGVLATTSANISGTEPSQTAEELHDLFGDDVAIFIDNCGANQASTIVEWRDGELVFHRIGAIPRSEIEFVLFNKL